MKRFAIVLALVLAFAISAGAQDFNKFSANVPEGWAASVNGNTTYFTKDDNMAMVTVIIEAAKGQTMEQIAKDIAAEYKQDGFKNITTQKTEDGDYELEMKNPQDLDTHIMITAHKSDYVILIVTGGENAASDTQAILNSLDFK